jgi:hypothetical protein
MNQPIPKDPHVETAPGSSNALSSNPEKPESQPAGYTAKVTHQQWGYWIWQITLSRGSHHFVVRPFARIGNEFGRVLGRMEITTTLKQAHEIGEKFKQAVIEEGYAVD